MALKTGLISHWALEETSGSRADSFGSNTLTDNNTVTSAAGKVGTAAQFTAANSERLSIADNASLSFTDEAMTVAAWVYLDTKAANDPDIVAKGRFFAFNNSEYHLRYRTVLDRFQFLVSDGAHPSVPATADTFGAPSTGTWYYLQAQHDPVLNVLRIRVNNGAWDETAWSFGIQDLSETFNLGANSNPGSFWDGRLDEVSLWRALKSTADLDAIYNGGAGLAFALWDVALQPAARVPAALAFTQRLPAALPYTQRVAAALAYTQRVPAVIGG